MHYETINNTDWKNKTICEVKVKKNEQNCITSIFLEFSDGFGAQIEACEGCVVCVTMPNISLNDKDQSTSPQQYGDKP